MKRLFILANFIFFTIALSAEVRLPSILGDGMVLQQKSKTNLWGWATPHKKITIVTSWNNKTYTEHSSSDGKWNIKIETPEAGGPYTITISDGQPIVLSNVLIGEVWVCAGQSNVQMPVKGFVGQPIMGSCYAIVMASPRDNIRLLTVFRNESTNPMEDCQSTSWLETTPANVKEFSAIAYFFAKYLQKILQVPIGIICSAAGGTNIERWMDQNDYLTTYPNKSMDEVKRVVQRELYKCEEKGIKDWSGIKSNLKQVRQYIEEYKVEEQMLELKKGYGKRIVPEYKKLVYYICNYKKNIKYRKKLLNKHYINFCNKGLNLTYFIKIMLNKL